MSVFERICSRFCGGNLITPVDVSALLKTLLVEYFSSSENILIPALRERLVSESNKPIIIESSQAYLPDSAGFRPSILVVRGPWQVNRLGIGTGQVFNSTPTQYARTITGQHNIVCIGKLPTETDLLATEVFLFLTTIEPIVLRTLPISIFQAMGMTEIKAIKEGRDHYLVEIPVQYHFEIMWAVDITGATTTTTTTTTTTESP